MASVCVWKERDEAQGYTLLCFLPTSSALAGRTELERTYLCGICLFRKASKYDNDELRLSSDPGETTRDIHSCVCVAPKQKAKEISVTTIAPGETRLSVAAWFCEFDVTCC